MAVGESSTYKERQRAAAQRWRDNNRERISEYNRQYREANKAGIAEYQKGYSAEYRNRGESKTRTWVRNLHRNYRLTPDAFNALWAEQNGKCVICEVKMEPRGRSKTAVAVDHNHETGEVRGLLCRCCNQGLGHFKDNHEFLQRAADYLCERGSYAKKGKF